MPRDFATRVIPAAPRRMDRLALFTFATAFSIGACSGSGGTDPGELGVPMYGAPAVDGGDVDRSTRDGAAPDANVDAGFDAGSPAPTYGLPWPEDGGGVPDAGPPKDAASDATDAGPPDDGGAAALYGLPPIDPG